MTDRIYIGVDPSHSGWSCAIAKETNSDCNHPDKVHLISGKEKPRVIGSPQLIKDLKDNIFHIRATGKEQLIICIEQTRIHQLNRSHILASISMDIGSIAQAFRDIPIWLVYPQEWKRYLFTSGLIPEMEKKSNKGKATYQPVINKHFGTDLTDNELSAWAICYYNASNYRE